MNVQPMNAPIAVGDAGLVIRQNGEIHIFTTASYDPDPDKLTDEQIVQGRLLQIFTVVAKSEELQEQIGKIVDDLSEKGINLLEPGTVN